MKIVQTRTFKKAVKRLYANQKQELDLAIKAIIETPNLGQRKKGDLSSILVYKFEISKQQKLLAYIYEDQTPTLTLLAFGPHENFYRDLKAKI